jgi:ATP-dependent Zn protease
MDQIQGGVVEFEDASVEKNKIRYGLTSLLEEIDVVKTENKEVKEELEKAISIVSSKNTVVGSSISAGGNVTIGDQDHSKGAQEIPSKETKIEPKTNKNLLLYISIAVLLAIIIIMFIWFMMSAK